MATRAMDYDYIYFIATPLAVGVALALVRKRSAYLTYLVLLLILLANTPGFLDSNSGYGPEIWASAGLFLVLPFVSTAALSRLPLFYRRPQLLLISAPLAYFAAFVVAANIWEILGFSF